LQLYNKKRLRAIRLSVNEHLREPSFEIIRDNEKTERRMYAEICMPEEAEKNFHFISCARYSPSALSNARTKGAREAHSCRHKSAF